MHYYNSVLLLQISTCDDTDSEHNNGVTIRSCSGAWMQLTVILNATCICSVHTWYDVFCEAVVCIIQQACQLEWETVSLDATTEQNADLDPEWLELRTTLHVVRGYARRTKKQTLASTIVAKVLVWIRQWAAELPKKSRSLWLIET